MELKTIVYVKEENIAWITLHLPEVINTQNSTMLSELVWTLDQAKQDDDVRVIVLTGKREKVFSAGESIREFVEWESIDFIKMNKGAKRPYELIREIPKPVIAMVNGLALGGGCELAMACDIIIAAESARFGLPEISVGVMPGGGGTQTLARLMGEKKAKELIFTGEFISAEEALRLGLVNRVVPFGDLQKTVEELADNLKAKSPAILRYAKLSVNRSLETPLSLGMMSEMEFFAPCCGSKDKKEGAKAFLEKREPVYLGQ